MAIKRVAMPSRLMPIDAHDKACEFNRRGSRRMTSRFPLGIGQDRFARVLHRDRFVRGEDLVIRVCGGDRQRYGAVERLVAR